jgi:hypothetical protein
MSSRHTETNRAQGERRRRSIMGGLDERAHELTELEREGESDWTPILAISRVWLVVVPIGIVMLGLAFAAYYLTS